MNDLAVGVLPVVRGHLHEKDPREVIRDKNNQRQKIQNRETGDNVYSLNFKGGTQ